MDKYKEYTLSKLKKIMELCFPSSWKTPVGYSYYPIFYEDDLYYYIGYISNKQDIIDFYKDKDGYKLPEEFLNMTNEDFFKKQMHEHKNKILKLDYILAGFKEYNLCQK